MSRLTWCFPIAVAALAAVFPAQPCPAADPPTPAAVQPRLLVPGYFYPTGDGLKTWKVLLDSAAKVPTVAIANPDSGPGKVADPNYVELFKLARGSKATVIGYITFSYGKRPLSAIKADVDSWLHFYPDVGGIFFDEQPSAPEVAGFAVEAFAYARSKIANPVLVTNPGTVCAREYLASKDSPVACLYEGKDGYDKFQPPDWAGRVPAERFAVLVYNVRTADGMREALKKAAEKRAGYVYVTDADGPMPWGRLPTYWADELAAVVPGGK
ncbi:MAG: sorting domain protein [Gemmataceae bacterium]|nr:sorting domain protein [Gemmataceae bacterium]